MKVKLLKHIRKRYSYVIIDLKKINEFIPELFRYKYIVKDLKTNKFEEFNRYDLFLENLIYLGLQKWYKYPYYSILSDRKQKKKQRLLRSEFIKQNKL